VLALQHALLYLQQNDQEIQRKTKRTIILSDNMFAVYAVNGEWRGGIYQQLINECQSIAIALCRHPEIYWIKGHMNIPGNELADQCAKKAMEDSKNRMMNENMIARQIQNSHRTSCVRQKLTDTLQLRWRHLWQHPADQDKSIVTKELIPSPDQTIVNLMYCLNRNDLRLHYKLLADRCKLNNLMFKMNMSDVDTCPYCQNEDDHNSSEREEEDQEEEEQEKEKEDTLEHLFFQCPMWTHQRQLLQAEINKEIDLNKYEMNLKLLLTGKPLENFKSRLRVIQACLKFVKSTKRQL
jgi:ribonuclease HI